MPSKVDYFSMISYLGFLSKTLLFRIWNNWGLLLLRHSCVLTAGSIACDNYRVNILLVLTATGLKSNIVLLF